MRERATAVVIREGKVLLVRDKGQHQFSLPGGGVKKNEPSMCAAIRELYEELGLKAFKVTRLRQCDFRGSLSEHKVCLVEASGDPQLSGHELDKFIWWNMKETIPVYAHVKGIIEKVVLADS